MKTLRMLIIALALCVPAFAWNCPTGQIRQQAPVGTPTTTPFYDVVEGIAFICVPSPTPTPSPASSNSTSNSSSNSSASSNQSQKQKQSQTQSQVATGGNASSTSTGGNATGNGVNSNNSITNIAAPKIPVSSAITPPIMPTVPCFKGYGGSAQTMAFGASFGGGKIDKGCNARELARSFSGPQTTASCKILLATKEAQATGITMEDCLPAQVSQSVITPARVVASPAVTVNLVLPSGDLLERHRTVSPTVTKKAVRRHMYKCPDSLVR